MPDAMAYYVFRVSPERTLSFVGEHEKYADAREACRRLRVDEVPGNPGRVRMVFAASEQEARRLLSEKRQPSSPLEEWEA
jgi:hypothetical protein